MFLFLSHTSSHLRSPAVFSGGALLLARHGNGATSFHSFAGEPTSLRLVPEIVAGAFQGHALAVVQFGILLLIATPMLRVLFVGIGYLIERDWLYVVVAVIVLAVLFLVANDGS